MFRNLDGGKRGGGDCCGEAVEGESGKRLDVDLGTGFEFWLSEFSGGMFLSRDLLRRSLSSPAVNGMLVPAL